MRMVRSSLLAQDTASITGTVTDPSGAAVKDAQVVVSSPDRGLDRTTTTNDSGDFLVAGLPPGAVNVTVTAGFPPGHDPACQRPTATSLGGQAYVDNRGTSGGHASTVACSDLTVASTPIG